MQENKSNLEPIYENVEPIIMEESQSVQLSEVDQNLMDQTDFSNYTDYVLTPVKMKT